MASSKDSDGFLIQIYFQMNTRRTRRPPGKILIDFFFESNEKWVQKAEEPFREDSDGALGFFWAVDPIEIYRNIYQFNRSVFQDVSWCPDKDHFIFFSSSYIMLHRPTPSRIISKHLGSIMLHHLMSSQGSQGGFRWFPIGWIIWGSGARTPVWGTPLRSRGGAQGGPYPDPHVLAGGGIGIWGGGERMGAWALWGIGKMWNILRNLWKTLLDLMEPCAMGHCAPGPYGTSWDLMQPYGI